MCDINVVPLPEHHIFLWGDIRAYTFLSFRLTFYPVVISTERSEWRYL